MVGDSSTPVSASDGSGADSQGGASDSGSPSGGDTILDIETDGDDTDGSDADTDGSESGASESGASESGASESGASESGASESGASESGASESDTDEPPLPALYCEDADGDGFGNPYVCETYAPGDEPEGWVPAGNGDDCDDTAADTYPGAAPNDHPVLCMKDSDGDDYGDDSPPAGVTPGTDCNDDNPDAWRCAVLVTQDGTSDYAYDEQIVDVLEGSGFEVTLVEDVAAEASDADEQNLVIISETAHSTDVAGTYRDVTVPVICMEGLIWDDMGMAPSATTWVRNATPIPGPFWSGLEENTSLLSGEGSGTLYTTPNANATIFVRRTAQPNGAIGFAFESGAAMHEEFVAPARRIGLGYDHDRQGSTEALMTDEGLEIFEAAVRWAIE